jgi:hypothetical protein
MLVSGSVSCAADYRVGARPVPLTEIKFRKILATLDRSQRRSRGS